MVMSTAGSGSTILPWVSPISYQPSDLISHIYTSYYSIPVPEICLHKSVFKICPISTRTVSIRHQSSRKFVYAYMLPIRDLWTARFLCLSFVFYDKKSKRNFASPQLRFLCDLYAAVFPQMSPPPPTKNCARLRTTKHNGRFYSFINKISFHGSRRFIFTGSCSATHGMLLS